MGCQNCRKTTKFAGNIGEYYGWKHLYKVSCSVEIKSEVGDNYPAILRKMKANERAYRADFRVLVFDNVTASGANLEQVKQIFRSSEFHVLSFSELHAAAVPK